MPEITALLLLAAVLVFAMLQPRGLPEATATRLRLRAKPHVYACAHLANSASTLLPVSNLTNLLAFRACRLPFLGFAGLMAAPWLVGLAVEFVSFQWFFATDLTELTELTSVIQPPDPPSIGTPRFALTGTGLLAGKALARRQIGPWQLVGASSPLFCLFVLALGVVVALCNLVNNLPATLVLLGALGHHAHPGLVLAALLGVNIGPNLTSVGSLASLLWRRTLAGRNAAPTLREFLRLGALTVPASLAAGTFALWLALSRGWLA